jgi:hypothetical protein
MRCHSRLGIYAMTWILVFSSGRIRAQAATDWSATDRALGRSGAWALRRLVGVEIDRSRVATLPRPTGTIPNYFYAPWRQRA